MARYGILLGLLFCLISAAFDVYVAFMTQTLNTMLVIFYCFASSSIVFMIFALCRDPFALRSKLLINIRQIALINVAVLLNWGGLFYALRYLEPAVVGVASVACGPALTLMLSFVDERGVKVGAADALVSCLVLASVGIMLFNSFVGDSGVSTTTTAQRVLGIFSVMVCASGTVMYTIFSKKMFAEGWATYEILAVRNFAMIAVCLIVIPISNSSFLIEREWILSMVVLVVAGHLLPVFLIQKTIFYLPPIHVSLVLLTLPVFVMFLQYLDARVEFSIASASAIGIIVILLGGRASWSLYIMRRG